MAAMTTSEPRAHDIELGGLVFSDRDGSIVLHDGWGSGTSDDPFVLVEDIISNDNAVLSIGGLQTKLRQGALFGHPSGFTLTKIVTNRTEHSWHIFELELRETLERPSSYRDGLSFAQSRAGQRIYHSDRFTRSQQTDEPLDAVTFSGAIIAPGETVSVNVLITDFSPLDEFFLLQRRPAPLAFMAREPQ